VSRSLRARLSVEQFEDRLVPASNLSVTVTTLGDTPVAGQVTLRQAIDDSNTNVPSSFNQISFASSLWGKTITLDPKQGELLITQPVVIGSLSMTSNVTVQPDPTSKTQIRVLHTKAQLELDEVNLTGGAVPKSDGGGLLVDGTSALITDCNITKNSAFSGGGIALNNTASSLLLNDSTVSNNTAAYSGGGVYVGASAAQMFVTNAAIDLNTAGSFGGGIYTVGDVNNLNNVDVGQNQAQSAGGGIWAAPGAAGNISLTNGSNVHDNQLLNPNGQLGGGIYLSNGSVTLNTVTIANNKATTGNGMYVAKGATTSETGVTWTNNTEYDQP
jgi:hypothetical protein